MFNASVFFYLFILFPSKWLTEAEPGRARARVRAGGVKVSQSVSVPVSVQVCVLVFFLWYVHACKTHDFTRQHAALSFFDVHVKSWITFCRGRVRVRVLSGRRFPAESGPPQWGRSSLQTSPSCLTTPTASRLATQVWQNSRSQTFFTCFLLKSL